MNKYGHIIVFCPIFLSSISGSAPSMNKLGWIEYFITSLDFDLIYYVTVYRLKYEHAIVFTYIVPNELTDLQYDHVIFLSLYRIAKDYF